MNTPKDLVNVVIIGGGPAGLSAAVYNSRAGLEPVVFAGSPSGGQLMLTTEVENFPGIASILGPELIQKMREQSSHFGAKIMDENVLKVDFLEYPYKVYTSKSAVKKILGEGVVDESQDFIRAKSIIIATGAKALWMGLESEQRLRGKGVSACATCDGFFFRNKEIAVVGGGDSALEEALTLTKFGSKVYVIHRREAFRASKIMQDRVLNHPKIEVVWNAQVEEVLGTNKVEGIKLKIDKAGQTEERTLPVEGVFVAIGHKPDTELFQGQTVLDQKGYVVTSQRLAYDRVKDAQAYQDSFELFDFKYQTGTNRRGIFAAGDNVDIVYRQASTASGMGVAAALDAERWLGTEME